MRVLYMPAIKKRSASPPERSNHIWHCNDAPSTATILSLSSLIAASATFDFGLSNISIPDVSKIPISDSAAK